MADYEMIVVALISTIGMIVSIMMWNHNWFKRLDAKYKYQLKRAKLSKKMNTKIPEERTGLQQVTQWLPLLQKLDGDQIAELADVFMGGGTATSEGGIGELLDLIPEDVIKGFLDGLGKKEEKPPTQQNY